MQVWFQNHRQRHVDGDVQKRGAAENPKLPYVAVTFLRSERKRHAMICDLTESRLLQEYPNLCNEVQLHPGDAFSPNVLERVLPRLLRIRQASEEQAQALCASSTVTWQEDWGRSGRWSGAAPINPLVDRVVAELTHLFRCSERQRHTMLYMLTCNAVWNEFKGIHHMANCTVEARLLEIRRDSEHRLAALLMNFWALLATH